MRLVVQEIRSHPHASGLVLDLSLLFEIDLCREAVFRLEITMDWPINLPDEEALAWLLRDLYR